MNSSVLFAFLVCFVCIDLTLSKSVQIAAQEWQTAAQEWHQAVKLRGSTVYCRYLAVLLAFASSGKNFIKQPDTLTDDCVRTARVTMNSITKPTTYENTEKMIDWSAKRTFNEITDQNPMEMFCKNLNLAAKQSQFSVANFEELKNQVELPKPTNNFVIEIPQGMSVQEFLQKPLAIDDVEFLKYAMMLRFLTTNIKTAKAIFILSERDALKSVVDSVFLQARDDYLKELSKKTVLITDEDPFKDFSKKVDEYFMNDSALKEEYKKLINQV